MTPSRPYQIEVEGEVVDGADLKAQYLLGMDEEERAEALAEKVPMLLSFLLRHMASAPFFMHRRTRRCEKCDLRGCCGRS